MSGRLRDRLFALLVRIFPGEFRERFGDEMHDVLRADHEDATTERRESELAFWGRALWGVVRAAPREHAEALAQDVRYALRMMRRRPLFTTAAALSLAVGIAATTTVVAVYDAAFLRTIPGIAAADEIVNVKTRRTDDETFTFTSYPNWQDLRERFAGRIDLMGFTGVSGSLTLGPGAEPERVGVQVGTPNYFDVLGVRPPLGRAFGDADERTGRRVVVLSDWLWRNRLGADPAAVGEDLLLNGTPFTVIGIAPPGFRSHFVGFNFDVFVPTASADVLGLPDRRNRESDWIEMAGRRADGVTVEQAATLATVEAANLERAYPSVNRGLLLVVEPYTGLDADLSGGLRTFLLTLLGVAGLVLLIACGNVANMVLARVTARHREMALRCALGAGRARLVRQLLTENVVLAALAAGAGVLLAIWATSWTSAGFTAFGHAVAIDARIDGFAVAVAIALAGAATVVFGLLPALRVSRTDLATALKQGDPRSSGGGGRVRGALVVCQVVLSLVVLVSAGLFVRTLQRASELDPGFDATDVYVGELAPTMMGMDRSAAPDLLASLLEQGRSVPSAEHVALTSWIPLGLGARFFPNPVTLGIPGHAPPQDRDGFAIEHAIVSDGYFETMRISLVAGRGFFPGDDASARGVAVVNETFVRRFFDGDLESVVGQSLHRGEDELEIVGVARDGKYRKLDESPTPFVYLAWAQHPRSRAVMLARARPGAGDVPLQLRAAIRERAPYLPVAELGRLDRRLSLALLPQRIAGGVVGALGIVALFLTAVGLYGVIAYSVGRRAAEIGVRMSLGARPRDVLTMVVRGGLGLVLVGLALGIPAAAVVTRAFSAFLLGVSPLDVPTYATIGALLVVTAVVASWIPARRAASIDPVRVLRSE